MSSYILLSLLSFKSQMLKHKFITVLPLITSKQLLQLILKYLLLIQTLDIVYSCEYFIFVLRFSNGSIQSKLINI